MLFSLYLLSNYVNAQKKLPMIHAHSEKVSICDDGFLERASWYLNPSLKPDTYQAYRSRKSKWVVFYTDLDSIKFKVKPGQYYDFIILLKGKDTCYTRIESILPVAQFSSKKDDTIPFMLSKEKAIVVNALVNGSDSITIHLDLGTYDFRITEEGRRKVSQAQIKTISIGKTIWKHAAVGTAKQAARGMDGRFGWHAFENKILTIDSEKQYLIISERLPKNTKQYKKMDIAFIKSWPCLESTIQNGESRYKSYFLMDNGSELAMVLNKDWMIHNQFSNDLKVIKESTISDGAGNQLKTKTVMISKVNIAGFELKHIPTLILEGEGPMGEVINYFGNDILKRFNLVLDFKHDKAYIKLNSYQKT